MPERDVWVDVREEVGALIARYRSARHSAESPSATAMSVLTSSRPLDEHACTVLALAGEEDSRRASGPDITEETIAAAKAQHERDDRWMREGRWKNLPAVAPTMQMAMGLVELERLDADDIGWLVSFVLQYRAPRALSRERYRQLCHDTSGEAMAMWLGGWLPSRVVALIAGIVTAFVTGDLLWPFLLVAVGGALAGYASTIAMWIAVAEMDERWLRLGRFYWDAIGLVYCGTGPVVVLLLTLLALGLA